MITLTKLENYLIELQNSIQEINYINLFMDDSQLANIVRDKSLSDNTYLLALIPSHKPEGQNIDSIYSRDFLEFYVVDKYAKSDGHTNFLEVMKNTQQAARQVLLKMINDATDDSSDCIMKMVDPKSFMIDPVFELVGTAGYVIAVNIKTNI
jgi:hypothetical protein